MNKNNGFMSVGLAVGLVLAWAQTGAGVDFYWANAAGGSWSNTNNWSGGIMASGSLNTAVFPVTAAAVVTVDQDSDIGALRFPSGSYVTVTGANTLNTSSVDVGQTNQPILISAPMVCGGWFYKEGVGTAIIPTLSGASGGIQIKNGALVTRSLSSGNALLGDSSTPANGTVQFLLSTAGDVVANDVWLGGYGNNFTRILGGVNTSGLVTYYWISAGSIWNNNEILLTAAAGGQVAINNVTGNSGSPLIKIGAGTLKITTWGADAGNRSYSGGTTVRNGTLWLGEDDSGATSNGAVLANGRTSNGAGGSLGYNDFVNPVQLGDSRYVVMGSGYDIWGTSDEFHCIAGALTNDGQIVTRLLYQQNTDAWAKAGLMMRETLAGNSRNAMMLITPSNGATFQWRETTGGESTNVSSGGSTPSWLKLVRAGDVFSGYISSDGLSWSLVGTATVSMDSVIQVGLVVSSHNTWVLAKGLFECVSGLPSGWVSQDVGAGVLAGSGVYTGTMASDDVSLLVANTRWIGHALQVNPLGRSVTIGGGEAGSCTFAGPVVLGATANLVAPAGGDVLFEGPLSGVGGVVKTGSGLVRLAGTNTYGGSTVVSNGQLKVVSSVALPTNAVIDVAEGATVTISASLGETRSLTKAGPGVMVMTAPQAYAGSTVIAGGVLRLGVPGLYEGRLAGAFNTTDANPNWSIQMTTRYANSTDTTPWGGDNATFVYSGYINNPGPAPVTTVFAENFDDNVQLKIDGGAVLYDTTWNNQTTNSVVLAPGWHSLDLRLGQGGFGVGPASGTGVDGNTGLGVAYSNQSTGAWVALTDNTGNFLDSGAPTTGFLSTGTTVSVASGAILDLGRGTQTVAGVAGSGVITNGQLVVTGTVMPGGSSAIGTLDVKGNLEIDADAVGTWDFGASSCDQVNVSGTLTLPAVATLNLNGLEGTYKGQRLVLFTFGSYSGPTDLRGWSVGLGTSVKVDLVNKQVILLAPGTLLSVF